MRAPCTLGDETRKPNRLTLTPEQLLTPDALHEAEAEELNLEAEAEMIEEVEEPAGFARKPAVSLDCQSSSPDSITWTKLGPQTLIPKCLIAKYFAPLDSTNRNHTFVDF